MDPLLAECQCLLVAVSSAVDLIMAHFSISRDPDEKMRLGNSSYSPTISALVLEHLCPAIQNLLNDGLRNHKLDFIIGQRRNHSWNVVEVSTRIARVWCWIPYQSTGQKSPILRMAL
uniref:RUN domain-containing protein n=1 Tax=Oryzias latipes TaxID=8090 RepID=A0A3B3I3T7_ORYLA